MNCAYPGLVPTDMGNQLARDVVTLGLFPTVEEAVGTVLSLTPQGRLGEVVDMADAVVSSPPTWPASSPARACPSTAAWACERDDRAVSTDEPVMIYGSGHTGRLVCEYLREYNVGRDPR